MSIKTFNPRTLALIIFILLIGVVRTYLSVDENMFGLSNFSPVGAMALFGGAYFDKKWKSFFFPLFTLLVSDVVLQFTVFYRPGNGLLYGGWYYVYGAFILMVLVGRCLKKINLLNIFLASIAAVIIHWLVTGKRSKCTKKHLNRLMKIIALSKINLIIVSQQLQSYSKQMCRNCRLF